MAGTTYTIKVEKLAKDNNISNPNVIQAGQTLSIFGLPTVSSNGSGNSGNTGSGNSKDNGSNDGWTYDDFSYDDFTYDEFTYDDYTESDTVKNAGAALDTHLANKPGEYQSQWQSQLDQLMNSIMNREKFSYDLNGDALYQQYKDKYIQQGKMAMGDAIGQASAMTGGYGNSYAQSVGQQQYQAQLQNLNDIVPQLYQMALDKYNMEGQDLYNQYGMVMDRENLDYGRYRDTVSDWTSERDYLAGRYDSERDYDYSKYVDERNFAYDQYSSDRTLAYDKYSSDRNHAYDEYATDKKLSYDEYRAAIQDAQWQKEYEESVRQYNEQMKLTQDQWEWQKSQASASGGGGGGGGVIYNNGGDDDGEFHKATFARTDDKGNNVFYINGKEYTYAPGVNPYTGGKNKDVKYGTFSNGYQPNNINGKKLSKSGITDVVNGVTQNVWKTPDGKLWIWDGTQNRYLQYEQ